MREIASRKKELKGVKEEFDWTVKVETWKTVAKRGISEAGRSQTWNNMSCIESQDETSLSTMLQPVPSAFYDAKRTCFEGTRRDTLKTIVDWTESDAILLHILGTKVPENRPLPIRSLSFLTNVAV